MDLADEQVSSVTSSASSRVISALPVTLSSEEDASENGNVLKPSNELMNKAEETEESKFITILKLYVKKASYVGSSINNCCILCTDHVPVSTVPFINDRGLFESDYTKLPTKEIRDFVLQHDPCQPEMKFPDNAKGRHFSVTYYFIRTATGQSIRRTWLCYSPSLQKVYCENCWLF